MCLTSRIHAQQPKAKDGVSALVNLFTNANGICSLGVVWMKPSLQVDCWMPVKISGRFESSPTCLVVGSIIATLLLVCCMTQFRSR